ncbi:hypothetical protein MJT46_007444 [Ovis ammon polii x Ovis aries]|nr:hypothetical protein MJT46_007444 [Ovis ammon polii x Ovis aries]
MVNGVLWSSRSVGVAESSWRLGSQVAQGRWRGDLVSGVGEDCPSEQATSGTSEDSRVGNMQRLYAALYHLLVTLLSNWCRVEKAVRPREVALLATVSRYVLMHIRFADLDVLKTRGRGREVRTSTGRNDGRRNRHCEVVRPKRKALGQAVTDQSVKAFAEHCPELQCVGFMGCSVTSKGVIHLTKLRNLSSLDLRHITELDNETVMEIVKRCKNLSSLNLCLNWIINDSSPDLIIDISE